MAFCGVKNVGKTTLLCGLIPALRARSLKVAVIKSDGHDFEPDVPGTDSYRLTRAGAAGVAVYSPYRYMIVREMTVGLEDLAPRFADCHLILLEGGKNSPYPKIELLRQGVSEGLVGRPPHLAYCVSGQFELTGAPRLEMDDYEGLADLLESYLRR